MFCNRQSDRQLARSRHPPIERVDPAAHAKVEMEIGVDDVEPFPAAAAEGKLVAGRGQEVQVAELLADCQVGSESSGAMSLEHFGFTCWRSDACADRDEELVG